MKFQLFDSDLEASVLASAVADPEIHREICGWPADLFGNPVSRMLHNVMCRLASRGHLPSQSCWWASSRTGSVR